VVAETGIVLTVVVLAVVVPAVVVLAVSYVGGAIPFTNLAARSLRGVDLRSVGTGTVSGTSLYRVAGFVPLARAGLADVAKGSVGPLLAGSDRPYLAALAGGLAVVGHDWSVFLRGAGGRGVAPALGALAVQAWPGVVVLGAGLGIGRSLGHSGLGTFVGLLALVPTLAVLGGRQDAFAGLCVAVPILVKRLVGNDAPASIRRARILRSRLLFDNDGGSTE
jgi:acyl phosphate:glycerol-3-phosphate acyltransferase